MKDVLGDYLRNSNKPIWDLDLTPVPDYIGSDECLDDDILDYWEEEERYHE
jgi:hypothetical protein